MVSLRVLPNMLTNQTPVQVSTRWPQGNLLAMSGLAGQTDYEHGLVARTLGHGIIDICLPAPGRVILHDVAGEPEAGGDYLTMGSDGSHHLVFVDAHHLLIRGQCEVIGDHYRWTQRDGLTLVGVPSFFDESLLGRDPETLVKEGQSWVEQLELPEAADPKRRALLRRAALMIRSQIMSPEGSIRRRWSTPDRWPHRQMWLWDSVFHAIGWRHLDLALSREIVQAVIDAQGEDGFIPHMISPTERSEITQPPVLAFGVVQLLDAGADLEWAREVYPRLVAYLQWSQKHRDSDGNGLLEWFIEEVEECRSGESGMDNSPRFDQACQLDAVDFNAFFAQELRMLAEIAERLGLESEAQQHRQQWRDHCRLINQYFWNPTTGFYHDHDPATKQQQALMASSGFLPLFCGAADMSQAEQIVEHLDRPDTFGTALQVPSIAHSMQREDCKKDMWRGPVWMNMNWLIAYSLEEYGFQAHAERIRLRSCQVIDKYFEQYGVIFEFYDDDDEVSPPNLPRKGQNAPEASPYHQVIHDFGWSGSLLLDWAYQHASC